MLRNCHADVFISAAVIEQPLRALAHQAFHKDHARNLPNLFPRLLWLKQRLVRSRQHSRRIVLIEQDPARPPEEKGAQVFDHLKALDRVGRQSDPDHLPILDRASVENPHDASAGYGVDARADDRAHEAQQGIAFQHAIGVQRAEVRSPAQVDAHVQGVRLAASLLADHQGSEALDG